MADLEVLETDEILDRALAPMFELLDKKNITKGVNVRTENEELYICFDKNCLSKTNQQLLQSISFVYSETFFHSDNKESPKDDRLEYWCPDKHYDERSHITERCHAKKMIVLELDLHDKVTILGTSIMLANVLQEQNPMELEVNKEVTYFTKEDGKRRDYYFDSGYPDLKWLYLEIALDKNNPLRDNPYAPSVSICEINNPVSCDNMFLTALVGWNEKTYLSFCMDWKDLDKAIKEYFGKQIDDKEDETMTLGGIQRKLLR